MARRQGTDATKFAQAAAYLRAVHGLTPRDIAARLEISESQVSRLLAQAEKAGVFRREVRYRFFPKAIGPEDFGELQRRYPHVGRTLEDDLQCRLDGGKLRPQIHVVETGRGSPELRLEIFGELIAERVFKILLRSRTIAVTWGGTLKAMLHGLQGLKQRLATPAQFIPVCGEPGFGFSSHFSSSRLAELFAEVLNPEPTRARVNRTSRGYDRISLAGVPAFLPRDEKERAVLRRALESRGDYVKIFGRESRGGDPLIARVDTLLTSAGPVMRDEASYDLGFREAAGELKRPLNTLAVGDIGGVLLERQHLAAKDSALLGSLRDMWTGIRQSDLERISRAAWESHESGVVICVIGENKAELVAHLLSAYDPPLVNTLFIDVDLAKKLVTLI